MRDQQNGGSAQGCNQICGPMASNWTTHRTHEEWLLRFDNQTIARCATREQVNLLFRAVTAGKFLKPDYVIGLLEARDE